MIRMNWKTVLAAAALCAVQAFQGASAQLPPEKVYSTGDRLERPMVMTPFTEFSSARRMPELKLQTLDGAAVDLTQYRGKVVFLNVWATWCAPCLREMPELIKLQKKYKDGKVAIIGVSIDEDPAKLPDFLQKYKLSEFETVADPKQECDKVMPLTTVPTNYILDGDGNLIGYLPGYLPWDDADVAPFLQKLVDKYAAGAAGFAGK